MKINQYNETLLAYPVGKGYKKKIISPYFPIEDHKYSTAFLSPKQKITIADINFVMPIELLCLQKTIEKSTYIFDLQNDWDDEGSLGYEKATWIKTVNFVIDYAKWILENFDEVMYIPEIYHGKESGIDILWENSEYRMLIRLDKQIEKGFFYSDNLHKQTSEGEFQVSKINYLMLPTPIPF